MELTTRQQEAILRDYQRNVASLETLICADCGENAMACAWDGTHTFQPETIEALAVA